jgi:hypothetical protein
VAVEAVVYASARNALEQDSEGSIPLEGMQVLPHPFIFFLDKNKEAE